MSNAALRVLFESCQQLTELGLYSNDSDLAPDTTQILDLEPVLHTYLPGLTELKVTGESITSSALQDIFTYCSDLHGVDIASCTQITDETIKILAQNCSMLRCFHLTTCKNVAITGVLEVVTRCSSLILFNLTDMPVNNEVLIQLSLLCHELFYLNIQLCTGGPLTEASIMAVVETCPQLEHVCLSGSIMEPLTPTLELIKQKQLYVHNHRTIHFYMS